MASIQKYLSSSSENTYSKEFIEAYNKRQERLAKEQAEFEKKQKEALDNYNVQTSAYNNARSTLGLDQLEDERQARIKTKNGGTMIYNNVTGKYVSPSDLHIITDDDGNVVYSDVDVSKNSTDLDRSKRIVNGQVYNGATTKGNDVAKLLEQNQPKNLITPYISEDEINKSYESAYNSKLKTLQNNKAKLIESMGEDYYNQLVQEVNEGTGRKGDAISGYASDVQMGYLQVKRNQAWDQYLKDGTYVSKQKALELDKQVRNFQNENLDIGKGALSSSANYIPQMVYYTTKNLGGAAAGLAAGALAGYATGDPGIGVKVGSLVYGASAVGTGFEATYSQTRGGEFGDMVSLGIPEDIAREASANSAFWQAVIEEAETAFDIHSLFTAPQSAETIGAIAAYLKAWGTNIITEGLEEGSQSIVGFLYEKGAAERAGLDMKSYSVENMLDQAWEEAKGGAEVGATMFLAEGLPHIVFNKVNNTIAQRASIENAPFNQAAETLPTIKDSNGNQRLDRDEFKTKVEKEYDNQIALAKEKSENSDGLEKEDADRLVKLLEDGKKKTLKNFTKIADEIDKVYDAQEPTEKQTVSEDKKEEYNSILKEQQENIRKNRPQFKDIELKVSDKITKGQKYVSEFAKRVLGLDIVYYTATNAETENETYNSNGLWRKDGNTVYINSSNTNTKNVLSILGHEYSHYNLERMKPAEKESFLNKMYDDQEAISYAIDKGLEKDANRIYTPQELLYYKEERYSDAVGEFLSDPFTVMTIEDNEKNAWKIIQTGLSNLAENTIGVRPQWNSLNQFNLGGLSKLEGDVLPAAQQRQLLAQIKNETKAPVSNNAYVTGNIDWYGEQVENNRSRDSIARGLRLRVPSNQIDDVLSALEKEYANRKANEELEQRKDIVITAEDKQKMKEVIKENRKKGYAPSQALEKIEDIIRQSNPEATPDQIENKAVDMYREINKDQVLRSEMITSKNNKQLSPKQVNSEGERLTPQQMKKYKYSVVRDSLGRLLVVYHTTTESMQFPFYVFQPEKEGKYYGYKGQTVIFVTPDKEMSTSYMQMEGMEDFDDIKDIYDVGALKSIDVNKIKTIKEAKELLPYYMDIKKTEDGKIALLNTSTGETRKVFKNIQDFKDGIVDLLDYVGREYIDREDTRKEDTIGKDRYYQYPMYMNIENPFVADGKGKLWSKIQMNVPKGYAEALEKYNTARYKWRVTNMLYRVMEDISKDGEVSQRTLISKDFKDISQKYGSAALEHAASGLLSITGDVVKYLENKYNEDYMYKLDELRKKDYYEYDDKLLDIGKDVMREYSRLLEEKLKEMATSNSIASMIYDERRSIPYSSDRFKYLMFEYMRSIVGEDYEHSSWLDIIENKYYYFAKDTIDGLSDVFSDRASNVSPRTTDYSDTAKRRNRELRKQNKQEYMLEFETNDIVKVALRSNFRKNVANLKNTSEAIEKLGSSAKQKFGYAIVANHYNVLANGLQKNGMAEETFSNGVMSDIANVAELKDVYSELKKNPNILNQFYDYFEKKIPFSIYASSFNIGDESVYRLSEKNLNDIFNKVISEKDIGYLKGYFLKSSRYNSEKLILNGYDTEEEKDNRIKLLISEIKKKIYSEPTNILHEFLTDWGYNTSQEEILAVGGYDGVWIKSIYDFGNHMPNPYYKPNDIYVAFSPNQVDLTSNKNPTMDFDIRRSESVGPKTTAGTTIPYRLAQWADRSKAKIDGNLIEYYHGSPFAKDEGFDQFKPRYRHNGAVYGDGYYLTSNYSRALGYTDNMYNEKVNAGDYVKSFVVNVLNPLDVSSPERTKAQILRNFDGMIEHFNPEFEGGMEYDRGWGGKVPTVEEMRELLDGTNEYASGNDWFYKFVERFVPALAKRPYINEYGVEETEYIDTREIYRYLGFDSIMDYSDIVLFESNQAKYLDNEEPTTDSRFAYSESINNLNFKKDTRPNDKKSLEQYRTIKNRISDMVQTIPMKGGYTIVVTPSTKYNDSLTIKLMKNGTLVKSIRVLNKDWWNPKDKKIVREIRLSDFKKINGLTSSVRSAIEKEFAEGIEPSAVKKAIARTRAQVEGKISRLEASNKKEKSTAKGRGRAVKWYSKRYDRTYKANQKAQERFKERMRDKDNVIAGIRARYKARDEKRELNRVKKNLIDKMKRFEKSQAYKYLTDEQKKAYEATFGMIYRGGLAKKERTKLIERIKAQIATELDQEGVVVSNKVKKMIEAPNQVTLSEVQTMKQMEELLDAFKSVVEKAKKQKELVILPMNKTSKIVQADFADAVKQREVGFDKAQEKRDKKTISRANTPTGNIVNGISGTLNRAGRTLKNVISNSLATLETELLNIAGGDRNSRIMDLYNNLNAGVTRDREVQVKLNQIMSRFMTDKKYAELRKSLNRRRAWTDTGMTVTDNKGKKHRLVLNRGRLMALAMHSLQEQSIKHISGAVTDITVDEFLRTKKDTRDGGGIRIPREDLMRAGRIAEAYNEGYVAKLTRDELDNIVGKTTDKNGNVYFAKLTEEENDFIKGMQEFFEQTREYLNSVSMALRGYKVAEVENYFPLVADKSYIYKKLAKGTNLTARTIAEAYGIIDNAGFVTPREEDAFNPIMLEDVADVLTRTIKGVSKYYGYNIALHDNKILLGTKFDDVNVEEALKKLDPKFQSNYKALEDFISGMDAQPNDLFAKFRGKHAEFTLGLNPASWVKQLLSVPTTIKYFTAEEMLKFVTGGEAELYNTMKNFLEARGEFKKGKVLQDFVRYLTGDLDYRHLGFGLADLSDVKENQSLFEKMDIAKGVARFDMLGVNTVTRMFLFAELGRRNLLGNNLQKLSVDEIDQIFTDVGQDLEHFLRVTQPDYSQVNRSNIVRQKGPFSRFLTMYSTPSLQMANNLMQSLSEFNYARSTGDKKLMASSFNTLMKSAFGIAASTIGGVLISRAFSKMFKNPDDEDEYEFGKEIVVAMLAPTLVLDDVARGLMGMQQYESQVPELIAFDAITGIAQDIYQIANGKESSKFKKWEDIIKSLGTLTGIPTRDFIKIGKAVLMYADSDLYYDIALRENTNAYKKWLDENTGENTREFYKAYVATREKKLISDFGYKKGEKITSGEGSRKEAYKKSLESTFGKDSEKVNHYMTILGGYKS